MTWLHPFFKVLLWLSVLIMFWMMSWLVPAVWAQETPTSAQNKAASSARLISTNAAATELVTALGLADQLVAVDVTSDNPRALPNIGYQRTLSAEGLLALQPSHVLGGSQMAPPAIIPVLQGAGVNVVQLPDALTLDALKQNIKALADALSARAQGDALVAQVDARHQQLLPAALTGKRIALVLAMDVAKLRLAGRDTHGDALIQLLGAQNVADFSNYQGVSAESLLALDPDAILVTGREGRMAQQLLTAYPLLASTRAGKLSHVLDVDGRALIAGLTLLTLVEAQRLQGVLGASAP